MWEARRAQRTPLQLPAQLTPQSAEPTRVAGQRHRLESEVRWLSEQLEAANTRNAQETDYMSAQLESERGRLATAQQESEQAAAKLEAAQAQITNQAAEFSARDAARSEQLAAAMNAHNAEHARLSAAAAEARAAHEEAAAQREADEARIEELSTALQECAPITLSLAAANFSCLVLCIAGCRRRRRASRRAANPPSRARRGRSSGRGS